MTTNLAESGSRSSKEDEGGGATGVQAQTSQSELDHSMDPQDLQSVDIFLEHVGHQQQRDRQRCDRRPSMPVDSIELPTLNGVVMRRKQQLQLRYQQQQQFTKAKTLTTPNRGRPLSISSISSAASSNSNSSANSSASSGIQSSLTRNGSLNYGHEYRKCAYLASIESLNNPNSLFTNDVRSIEVDLKNLNLSSSGQFKDAAAARAAVLAAGAQSRGFGTLTGAPRGSRINRSLHSSLRYDKNTAYRIHQMANARALLQQTTLANGGDESKTHHGGSISRNNSSTSSDSGHQRQDSTSANLSNSRFSCRCSSNPSIASSSSALQDETANELSDPLDSLEKSSRLNNGSIQQVMKHHPGCSYSKTRQKSGSAKLQPSPSSVSSHSNTSSLFRDDGFEDDLTSNTSDFMSSYSHVHRLSFQGRCQNLQQYLSRRAVDDDDEYQSCEEEFTTSHATTSTGSNLDDCALSIASSLMNQDQQVLDKISLANAKQQYRRSLLLEHQQQQHLLHAQHVGQTKIQSLLTTSPKINHIGHTNSSANSGANSRTGSTSPSKLIKHDDRTVNIIGHMPTRSPGYWDSNLSITQRVVTEIIETERAYVDDLEQIVTGYICYLRNVLKQQKHQQAHINGNVLSSQPKHQTNSSPIANKSLDDYDKLTMVFDDDLTSATNEIEDYEVEDADNDLAVKENTGIEHQEIKHRACTTDGAIVTANHIKKLFSNLEDIYKFNKDLLFRLEECYLNPSSVAECFVENSSGFEVYTHYCTMYPQVVSTLTELMGNQNSAHLLKERQNELNQSLPLGAYLLKPVQRILKYHILFQSLIKHTNDDDTVNEKDRQLIGEAFSVMTSIACHINAMKKRHEHAIRVQEVQGLLSGWEVGIAKAITIPKINLKTGANSLSQMSQGPDLTTLGELILEDTFKLYSRSKSARHLFLFDNVLLMTKKKRDGSLCYKGHIAVSLGCRSKHHRNSNDSNKVSLLISTVL
mgnify:CR=1 FL=1